MAMEVADTREIPGYMMSHPRTADLSVMPLVILLKKLILRMVRKIQP
jgi:hypothetical protein